MWTLGPATPIYFFFLTCFFFLRFTGDATHEQGHGRAAGCARRGSVRPPPIARISTRKCESRGLPVARGFLRRDVSTRVAVGDVTLRARPKPSLVIVTFGFLEVVRARRRKVGDVTTGDLAISEDATAKRSRGTPPVTPRHLSRW